MKWVLICFFTVFFVVSFNVGAYNYTGQIDEISNPIKLQYNPFKGNINGQSIIATEIFGSKETTTTKGTISIKKNNNRTIIIEYIFQEVGDIAYKLDIYTTPDGKVKNYIAWYKNYNDGWEIISKSEISRSGYKKMMNLVINSIISDYRPTFRKGDIIIEYPFREILGLFFDADGSSRSDFQLTNSFNLLDSIPEFVGSKLTGKTCFNGRRAYISEFNINHEYENYPSKSTFIIKGYQLIDIASGLIFHARYKITFVADFGETIDLGFNKFDMFSDEQLNLNFQDKNCAVESIKSVKPKEDLSLNKKNGDFSFEERLIELKSLFDKNLITKEEYDQKRREILDEM